MKNPDNQLAGIINVIIKTVSQLSLETISITLLRLRSGHRKILMKIRYRFNAFIKICQVEFFVGAVQVVAI